MKRWAVLASLLPCAALAQTAEVDEGSITFVDPDIYSMRTNREQAQQKLDAARKREDCSLLTISIDFDRLRDLFKIDCYGRVHKLIDQLTEDEMLGLADQNLPPTDAEFP